MSDQNESTPAYIARCKCGCSGVIMMTVDMPDHAQEVAHEVAACVREGYPVEHVTVGYARTFVKNNGFGCLRQPALFGEAKTA